MRAADVELFLEKSPFEPFTVVIADGGWKGTRGAGSKPGVAAPDGSIATCGDAEVFGCKVRRGF